MDDVTLRWCRGDVAGIRCGKAQEICAVEEPRLVDPGIGHEVACHLAEVQQVL